MHFEHFSFDIQLHSFSRVGFILSIVAPVRIFGLDKLFIKKPFLFRLLFDGHQNILYRLIVIGFL